MPYPTEWTITPREEVDYGEVENLDVAEDDGLFSSGEGPVQTPDFDSSSIKSDNDVSMGNNDVAEVHLSPKVSQPISGKQSKKTGEIDDEEMEELPEEILTKRAKHFKERKVLDTEFTKTQLTIRKEPKPNDGEGGGEAMDISDDSGSFEELDENGAEILGIEKDLQDIEAQEDKLQKNETDSDSAEKALATLKAELRGPSIHRGAKFDPKDGPIVPCEMEFNRILSPFGHVNFYPKDHELQAGLSDYATAKQQHKNVSLADEEISPKNKATFDSRHSGTAKLKFGGPKSPYKVHKLPKVVPSQFPGSLPSPPPTEVDSEPRRNAFGATSYMLSTLSPESINKQASSEVAKDATGYLFGEKPPWYKEQNVKKYLFGEKPPWYKERESIPLPEASQGSNAVPLLDRYKKISPFKSGAPKLHGWDRSAKTVKATNSWPPWMTAEGINSSERKGIDGLSIASLHQNWMTNVPMRVNMVSLPQGGMSTLVPRMPRQGAFMALGAGSSQSAFGYETSDASPKKPKDGEDQDIRDYLTTHRVLFCSRRCAVSCNC